MLYQNIFFFMFFYFYYIKSSGNFKISNQIYCFFLGLYFLTFFLEKTVINHLLGLSVFEDIFQVRLKRPGSDQIKSLKATETPIALVFKLCDPPENVIKKNPANDRSFLKNPFRLVLQSVKSC